MKKADLILYFILSSLCFLVACARPIPPSGGDDDTDPPRIIKESSTPNFQTNFTLKEIELVFDEWIQLSNPIKEIHVSPPTEFFPSYKVKGKSLHIEFNENEILKEDLTYQINFGNAIKDFTAGNILKNERFVFSTGDKIDSLTLVGKVVESTDQKDVANIIVGLYDNLSDTAFTHQKPFYFVFTDKQGQFKFQNIKQDSFQIFALEDLNGDYKYSSIGERVAFNDSIILLNDSFDKFTLLELFKEEPELDFIKTINKQAGLAKLVFNKFISQNYRIQSSIENHQEAINDTLYFWYKQLEVDSFQLLVPGLDTSWYFPAKRDTSLKKIQLDDKFLKREIYSKDTLFYNLKWPISNIESDSIKLIDTVANGTLDTVLFEGREMGLVLSIKESSKYDLVFLPNAISNWRGQVNDSIVHKIKTGANDDFGNISVKFDVPWDSIQYIVKLLQKEEIIASQILNDSLIVYPKMTPGKYSIEVVGDLNRNKKWDTGVLKDKRSPEPIYKFDLEQLKKSWDVETTIKID